MKPVLRTTGGALAGAAFIALAGGLLALYWLPEAKLLAGDERGFYYPAAQALLEGGDWFDRQMLWPPLQVLFLAGVFALPGPDLLAVQIAQLSLLAASGLLLRRLWLDLTGDAIAAGWAGVVLAVNPLTIAFATYLWPEIVHLFLSLVLAWLLLAARRPARSWMHSLLLAARRPARSWMHSLLLAAAAGAIMGLCLLSKSLLTGFWPVPAMALIARDAWRLSLLRVLAFVLAMGAVTAPALSRGFQETGRPQIADSSWFNLWAGLADRQRSSMASDGTGPRLRRYIASAPDHAGRVQFAAGQARALVDRQGVGATLVGQLGKQYFRLFDARNFLVAQLPGPERSGYSSSYRIDRPGLTRVLDIAVRAWHVALLVLFAFGLASWRDWRRPWLWLLAAFMGYQLLLFAFLHVNSRFLLPMLPVFCVFAGHRLAQLPGFGATAAPRPPPRRALGWLLAAVLATLALGGPVLDRAGESGRGPRTEGVTPR